MHANKANNTQLSKHIWKLKENNTQFNINWNIMTICKSYSNLTNRCNFCSYEKCIILKQPEFSSLNKCTELSSTCKHKRKLLLADLRDVK